MYYKWKLEHSKPSGIDIPTRCSNRRLAVVALLTAISFTASIALGALATNAVVNSPPVQKYVSEALRSGKIKPGLAYELMGRSGEKAASDQFAAQLHSSEKPSAERMADYLAVLPSDASPKLTLSASFSGQGL